MTSPSLSIVLPFYGPLEPLAESLPVLRHFLERNASDAELIVIDDGSGHRGSSSDLATRWGARFIAQPRNSGKGAAVRTGMLAARGELRVFTDADLPYEPKCIENVVRMLRSGQAQVVIGDRTLPDSRFGKDLCWKRRLASRLATELVGRMTMGHRMDTQCGLKGFTRQAAIALFEPLSTQRFAFDVEVLLRARAHGFALGRVPVQERPGKRPATSTVRLGRDGFAFARDLARVVLHRGRS